MVSFCRNPTCPSALAAVHPMKTENMSARILGLLLTATTAVAFAGDLPDAKMTPGAIYPEVTQANIKQTVCVKGFTKTIRPPAHFTNKLKKRQIHQYGYSNTDPKDYSEDHLIALSIGGAPEDSRNLWPQPHKSEWNAKKKDQLEFVLYKMVCNDEIKLKDAQHAIAKDWIQAWKDFVPSHRQYRFKKVD